MAKFSLGGDDGEGPSNKYNRRLPKRRRIAHTLVNPRSTTSNSAAAAAASAPPPPRSRQFQSISTDEDESAEILGTEPSDSSENDLPSEEEDDDDVVEQVQATAASESTEAVPPPVLTLTEPDVLDCPICLYPLIPPVYQCENGHISCASCCIKIKNKCANCCMPIGYNRCRALEKVLETVKISCRYTPHGCKESLIYPKKLDHEKTCKYAPYSCPHSGCNYVGTPKCLYNHFAIRHSSSSRQFTFNTAFRLSLDDDETHVFLLESKEKVVFVLNRSDEALGSCVNVVCIGHSDLSKKGYFYEVTARDGDCSIVFQHVAESTRVLTHAVSMKRYLLVPRDMSRRSVDQLKLKVIIWRDHE